MKNIKLNVRARIKSGRGAAKRLRASGEVPAVLYGQQAEAVQLAVSDSEVNRLLKEIAATTALVEISQEGEKPVLSIVQEVQRNPINDRILHVDFLEVSAKEEMETAVNIQIVGDAYGVTHENGTIDVVSYTVDVRCLPKDLPGAIELDVTELKAGESLHVKDLPKLEGVTYVADEDHVIVSCVEERLVEEEEIEEGVEAEAEPEAEGETPETEGESEASAE
ncbi:MAG TPA: 50S ribosomal protein L25 [Opitutales bacterium]|nr:50S ribosomal protein L25 [Opitutales bacterium]